MRIRDTGPGLPSELIGRVFDRFATASGRPDGRRGLGLGLSICSAIAAAHEGSLAVENPDGAGAMFTLSLPAADYSASDAFEVE